MFGKRGVTSVLTLRCVSLLQKVLFRQKQQCPEDVTITAYQILCLCYKEGNGFQIFQTVKYTEFHEWQEPTSNIHYVTFQCQWQKLPR